MISVIIISKNEEEMIEDCIKSVKSLADEIILVDDSTDRTASLADKLGARVVKNKFKNFSDQRNFALTQAKYEWVFYIDSDERVTQEFIKEVKEKINSSGASAYFVKRKTYYFNRDWNFTDKVERLFKKTSLIAWKGVVHETPVLEGSAGVINEPILHFTHRNLSQMLNKTNEWSAYEAKLRFDSNHPKMNWWRFIRVILTGFAKSYLIEKGYKNKTAGLIEAIYQSFSMFVTYSKLWEMQNKRSG